MPVEVKLLDLASINDARRLWPSEFEGFVKRIEEDPDDKTVLGVLADWLTEHNEDALAAACRYMTRREESMFEKNFYGSTTAYWYTKGLGYAVAEQKPLVSSDNHSPAGALADLARKIVKAREELE